MHTHRWLNDKDHSDLLIVEKCADRVTRCCFPQPQWLRILLVIDDSFLAKNENWNRQRHDKSSRCDIECARILTKLIRQCLMLRLVICCAIVDRCADTKTERERERERRSDTAYSYIHTIIWGFPLLMLSFRLDSHFHAKRTHQSMMRNDEAQTLARRKREREKKNVLDEQRVPLNRQAEISNSDPSLVWCNACKLVYFMPLVFYLQRCWWWWCVNSFRWFLWEFTDICFVCTWSYWIILSKTRSGTKVFGMMRRYMRARWFMHRWYDCICII